MAEMRRAHALIEDVWAIVSDPRTHPEWWPEVDQILVAGEPGEGDRYTRVERRFGFLDQVDGVWVIERLEHLKEAHFRCTISGSYARFALTPAQSDTFVEAEAGMLPTTAAGASRSRWSRRSTDAGCGRCWTALPRVAARKETAR